jgi:hypothetical protein
MSPEGKKAKRYARLVLFIIGMIVISIPLSYYLMAFQHLDSKLETEAEVTAKQVSQVISANPEYWQFTEHRLAQYISGRPKDGQPEIRRLIDIDNEIVTESADKVDAPFITRAYDLNDAGKVVGRLEITASLRPVLIETTLVFLFVLPVGLVAFMVIYSIPIKRLDRVEKAEQESRAKLEVAYIELQTEMKERLKVEAEREKLILELRTALAEIKKLHSLLPICASCKKIRDDQGYWNQLEVYLLKHEGIVFSHGICPECEKKLYPDFNRDDS